ncbi:serine/threonine protein kinase [Aspergillus sclerotioniger CBS 115572]|uniref:Serine/threonine protein kinase n=1 Tax=Aspergillus sclerotioniger CBS 115572 TaxID=1450535 RepID=A0A317WUK9_9EURO|nr:serine/threonine protein kinase [Aspergillus sclerotioniger CBS 115572]PWY88877.1 serine/threonine protein kinase [Aspergillus sclerotioniger CBS 115572]
MSISRIQKGLKLMGESGTSYTLLSPLVRRTPPNVWQAFRSDNERDELIIKHPQDETECEKRCFQREMDMQKLFKPSRYIRRMVDVIPASSNLPDMMVLEPFQKTLWSARTTRPLAIWEIKYIMRAALLELQEIHKQGRVYCDFKMENVLLSGFNNDTTNEDQIDLAKMVVKLSDLGSVMTTDRGDVTSLAYRSPEVYFKKPWTSAIDIWAWGIAYFHLIQAQINFSSPGIYDSIVKGTTLEQKETAVQASQVHDFNLRENEYYKDCDFSAVKDVELEFEEEHWTDRLVALGVAEYDVVFLYAVLEPDPTKRMTAEDIFATGYLDIYQA